MNCEWCGTLIPASRVGRFCGDGCVQANRQWCQNRAVALLDRIEGDPRALTDAFAEARRILGDLHG